MPTVRVNHPEQISINSAWTTKTDHYIDKKGDYTSRKPVFATGPTYGSRAITFRYSIPSGVSVKKAQIWAKVSDPSTGISILNVNGNRMGLSSGGMKGADVKLSLPFGSLTATFQFKANGTTRANGASQITMSDIYLEIEYEGGAGETASGGSGDDSRFLIPPQSVCIYHQDTGAIYMFDGVMSIQHSFSVKIDEEPDKEHESVNNAVNEPDKLDLDVCMSDVYSTNGNMTLAKGWDIAGQEAAYNAAKGYLIEKDNGEVWSRSARALQTLKRLKESRQKLSVITPQYVHVDMLIASISITQDDASPFGWEGQISFQHAYETKEKPDNNSSKKTDAGIDAPEMSMQAASKEKGNTIVNGLNNMISNIISRQ